MLYKIYGIQNIVNNINYYAEKNFKCLFPFRNTSDNMFFMVPTINWVYWKIV